MPNQLDMDNSLAIKQLRQGGMGQQAMADALGVSRTEVIRPLAQLSPNGTKAPTRLVPSRTEAPNSTKAPTGSEKSLSAVSPGSQSRCAQFREMLQTDSRLEANPVDAYTSNATAG